MPKEIRAWLPRRVSGKSCEVVFYEFPSAQQILQWGNSASTINGTSNVDSTNLHVFELRTTTIREQPDTDSVINFPFMMITKI